MWKPCSFFGSLQSVFSVSTQTHVLVSVNSKVAFSACRWVPVMLASHLASLGLDQEEDAGKVVPIADPIVDVEQAWA